MNFFFIMTLFLTLKNYPTERVQINLNNHMQKIEGWGVSLSWWAHQVGKSFSDQQLDTLCYWLTDKDELNMNVFRYNISGGDAPRHNHMRKDAQIPGYKSSETEDYDWSQDTSQRKILLKINRMRNDAIYEAANYSPPFWMTKSGCTAGDTLGQDNLKDDYYDEFANYLTDVVKHYKDKYGIVFRTISPVNEPFSNWWKINGKQEGCAFSQDNQEKIIRELYKSLKSKNMLSYSSIAVMDANSIDECVKGLEGYADSKGLLSCISQINTHSYNGTKRTELLQLTKKYNKRLWQSETGPLNTKLKGFDNFLFMAKRIVTDLNVLQPVAWCDWQYMSGRFGGVWGLVGYNESSKTFERTKGYYCRKQFSKYIKPGFTIVSNNNENILSAVSPDNKELVIVIVNEDSFEKNLSVELPANTRIVDKIPCIRTSENEDCILLAKPPIKVGGSKIEMVSKSKSITTCIVSLK